MTIALPPWLGPVVLVLLCAASFLVGGREERIAAAGLLASVATTMLLRDFTWPQLQRMGFAADLLMMLLLLGIALKSAKWWPLAAAGFQLLTVLTHVAKMVDRHVDQWAYITATVIWTYLLMAALGIGIWNSWQARRRAAPAEKRSGLQ